MKKKATWIKICAALVAAIPPVVVLIINFPLMVSRTDKIISAAALFVAIICACIFKDATKKYFQQPSAFKICLVVFIFSYISVTLGEQMLQISTAALISGACSIPLNIWYNHITAPATKEEMIDALQNIVKEKNKDEEEQQRHNEKD